ncbi:MAG: hypothetical protein ACUVTD_01110 [Nitrososphaerales archaeon]
MGKRATTVVIESETDKAWLGGLITAEGSIGLLYGKDRDNTRVLIDIRMTEKEPVERVARIMGTKVMGPYWRGGHPEWAPSIWRTR